MRGLSTRHGQDPPRRYTPRPVGSGHVTKAAITAVAVIAALGLSVSACGTGGTGARDEGPAQNDSLNAGAATPSASPSESRMSVDAVVEMVKADQEASEPVKDDLQPCVAGQYPVDVFYGNMTGGTSNDIVVNVMTCADAVGIASYVYREVGAEYRNVFAAEEPPVYAEIDRGDLLVTQQLYAEGDPVALPSSEDVITYRWTADRFVEQTRTHNDYNNAVGGADTPVPVPSEPDPAED
ncbi:hypothetical protein [Streptomyces sp. NPDC002845]